MKRFLLVSPTMVLSVAALLAGTQLVVAISSDGIIGGGGGGGGNCYINGNKECPERPTNTCGNILCEQSGLSWVCPLNSNEPKDYRANVPDCLTSEMGFPNRTGFQRVWCWKFALCSASCTQLSDQNYYCNSSNQGGTEDCLHHDTPNCTLTSDCYGLECPSN